MPNTHSRLSTVNLSEAESDEEEELEEEEEVEEEEEEDSDAEGGAATHDVGSHHTKSSLATSNNSSLSSLDAKAILAANLLLLNGPEWGHIVATVELESPKSLVNIDTPGYVELDLDNMDPKVLVDISKYAQERAASRKRPNNNNGGALPINDITGKKKRRK